MPARIPAFRMASNSAFVTGVIESRLPRWSTRMSASSGISFISSRETGRFKSARYLTSTKIQRGCSGSLFASK
jgi:hypothetical protein